MFIPPEGLALHGSSRVSQLRAAKQYCVHHWHGDISIKSWTFSSRSNVQITQILIHYSHHLYSCPCTDFCKSDAHKNCFAFCVSIRIYFRVGSSVANSLSCSKLHLGSVYCIYLFKVVMIMMTDFLYLTGVVSQTGWYSSLSVVSTWMLH